MIRTGQIHATIKTYTPVRMVAVNIECVQSGRLQPNMMSAQLRVYRMCVKGESAREQFNV